MEQVRRFVSDGGGLVASQETSLYTESGEKRTDFGFADLFHALSWPGRSHRLLAQL